MKEVLLRLFGHQFLGRDEARHILTNIASGKYDSAQIAAFMTVFMMRSISLDEVLGFRDALLEMCTPVDLSEYNPIDIVGTGGDCKNTFNISTAACFVVAGAGYKVCKQGNYGSTSVSGSSNVMEQHGVKFTNKLDVLRRSIEECNMAYLHAQYFHPALKTVAPIRKALGVPTFFNVLGPLVNPISPNRQVLGVYNLKMLRLYSYIYQQEGTDFAVVHSLDGYDEVSLTGDFKIVNKRGEAIYKPADFGMQCSCPEELYGGQTLAEAAAIFDAVLENRALPSQINVVIANAAVAIQTINENLSLEEAMAQARESIVSGSAMRILRKFVEINSK